MDPPRLTFAERLLRVQDATGLDVHPLFVALAAVALATFGVAGAFLWRRFVLVLARRDLEEARVTMGPAAAAAAAPHAHASRTPGAGVVMATPPNTPAAADDTTAALALLTTPRSEQRQPQSCSSPPYSISPDRMMMHSGMLRRRGMFNSKLPADVQLVREDAHSVALFYQTRSSSSSSLSTAVSKKRKSLYLGWDSTVSAHRTWATAFTVSQLPNGTGRSLSLEAQSIEERDEWISKVRLAIQGLKR